MSLCAWRSGPCSRRSEGSRSSPRDEVAALPQPIALARPPARGGWIREEVAVTAQATAEQALGSVARGEAPVLEQLAAMTLDTLERSGLSLEAYLLVRLAALVALDAPPASYILALEAAGEVGLAP